MEDIEKDTRIETPRRYIVQDTDGRIHTVTADDANGAKRHIEPAVARGVALLGTHETTKRGVARVGWKETVR
jgi:hypothetical protein